MKKWGVILPGENSSSQDPCSQLVQKTRTNEDLNRKVKIKIKRWKFEKYSFFFEMFPYTRLRFIKEHTWDYLYKWLYLIQYYAEILIKNYDKSAA